MNSSPTSIRLEASTRCQLDCPVCPTASGKLAKSRVGSGVLRLTDFQNLLEATPALNSVELSNYGEVFLNKELVSILECAAEHDVEINLVNGVNLNFATTEQLEALVKYRVAQITVALDGATQATYERYRSGGQIEKVLDHVRQINEFKQRYRSDLPKLTWQFVLFSYNEPEVDAARSMAAQLDMSFALRPNWSSSYFPVENPAQPYDVILPTPEQISGSSPLPIDAERFPLCAQLWVDPQVNWNGAMLGCCVNYWDDYGDVFASSITAVMESEKYRNTQKMLAGETFTADSPCLKCNQFRTGFLSQYYWRYLLDAPMKWKLRLLKLKVRKGRRRVKAMLVNRVGAVKAFMSRVIRRSTDYP
ncbi:hypothetical protein BOW53_07315 [Solemya pervernicosa gill symbiont]|uniref:4Fe4S-binding SPASM domain-containing protein n=2 Tax=Gammaproteobacteria incertae sedis TaxID=118884 RepID=A0A1T2L5W8_9GAMM|nr:radical SAM/SPASM domain-containing protein [Candidatus Reidiella endopervernicosa]OOZ40515.1 hypothetical protein BOW53_07315 [Solemya pervernicosa gill symbiont]QKQ27501.1 SPASM domain-containing protein [Candidatus Reidiella endopervernicosa]